MAEIALPVSVRDIHGCWVLETADGMDVCNFGIPYQPGDDGREVRTRAYFVMQAVNDRADALSRAKDLEDEIATLRAQVERVRALANRWSELADHFCRMSWGDLEAGARMMEATDSGMSAGFRQCAKALRAVLEGDGHPGDARGAHRAPDEGVG